mmetsp:Transcript_1667/g.2908  ORF Transcript_1667/g.2908 Transcript_1667/m.2908 type:complete len:493 (-) Transcript_1667:244-1722(-)
MLSECVGRLAVVTQRSNLLLQLADGCQQLGRVSARGDTLLQLRRRSAEKLLQLLLLLGRRRGGSLLGLRLTDGLGGRGGIHKALLHHPLVVENLGQVLDTRVRHHRDDDRPLCGGLGQLHGSAEVQPAASTDEHTVLGRHATTHLKRLLTVQLQHLVDHAKVHGARDGILPDALHLVRPRLQLLLRDALLIKVPKDGALGVRHAHLHLRLHLFQVLASARDGAAGAAARHKVSHGALGLLPDLRTQGEVVGLGVARVVVLVNIEVVGVLLAEGDGHVLVVQRVVGWLAAGAHQHLATVGSHGVPFLFGGLFIGDDDIFVATHGAYHGNGAASVAAGGGHDGAARAQLAFRLGARDNMVSDAVFDGTTGVEKFGFSKNFNARVGAQEREVNHGRVADEFPCLPLVTDLGRGAATCGRLDGVGPGGGVVFEVNTSWSSDTGWLGPSRAGRTAAGGAHSAFRGRLGARGRGGRTNRPASSRATASRLRGGSGRWA